MSSDEAKMLREFKQWMDFYSPDWMRHFTPGEIEPLRKCWFAATINAAPDAECPSGREVPSAAPVAAPTFLGPCSCADTGKCKHNEKGPLCMQSPEVFVSSDAYTAAVIIRSNAFDRRWADAEMVAKELLRIIECDGGVIRSPVNHLDANAAPI